MKRKQPKRKFISDLVAVVTGAVTSEKKDLHRSLGRLIQHAINGDFWQGLGVEWNKYKKEGKIKDDYSSTEQCREALAQLWETLENDPPDVERLKLLKAIFLTMSEESLSDRNKPLPLMYLKVARDLRGNEILTLRAAYTIYKSGAFDKGKSSASQWLASIAQHSALKFTAAVELAEPKLEELKLIGCRTYTDKSGISLSGTFRLTDFGISFCEFIENYKPD